jgi:predicted permease
VGAVACVAVTACALVGSVVAGTLFGRPAHGDPDRTVVVWGRNEQNGQLRDVVSGPNYIDLRRGAAAFEHMAALKPDDVVLQQADGPAVVSALAVTWEFFDVLGEAAARGRTFEPSDGVSGSEPVAVITDAAWRGRFGGAPDIVGRRLATRDGSLTVVGVLPPRFEFIAAAELFVPLHDDVLATYDRTSYNYWIVGLLRPGATIEQAAEQLETVMRDIRAGDPRLTGWSVAVEPLHATVTEAVRPVLLALAAAVAVLVLVAAANLGSLFLVHATALRPQITVLAALGAGRWRIIRRLATESCALIGAGAIAGLLIAVVLVRLLSGIVPPQVAISGSAAQVVVFRTVFDQRVATLALAVALVMCLVGTLPAIVAAMATRAGDRVAAIGRSRTASATMSAAHDAFVAAQIAFATLLLVCGALAWGSFRNLLAVDTGMQPRGVLTLYAGDLDDAESPARALYFRRVLESVAEVPGVVAVGLNDYVPLQAEDDFEGISFLDRPPPPPGQGVREEWRRVSEGFFAAAGVEVIAGRGFERADFGDVETVAVVNEAFARRHYPRGSVLGARLLIHERAYGEAAIVGVVRDVRGRGLREAAPPILYVPYHKFPRPNMALFVRADGMPAVQLVDPVREAIRSVDAQQPIDRIAGLEQVVANAAGVPRLASVVLLPLAATALVLAALGVFGVLAHAVGVRSAELGVRLALGATGGRLQRMVVARGLLLCAAGGSVGVLLALAVTRMAQALWFGVTAGDAGVLAAVAGTLLASALLAGWLPARRVGCLDASDVMRR